MFQCAVNPGYGVLAISTFILGNPLLLDFVYQALENGAAGDPRQVERQMLVRLVHLRRTSSYRH
jgi:hypothetical protein